MEMRCHRKILRISYEDHVTNDEVHARIQQATGPHEDLTIKKRREWTCLPFIRSDKNHLARYSERGMKTRQVEKEVGRQYKGMNRTGVCQVPESCGEQRKMEEICCEAPTTHMVKG